MGLSFASLSVALSDISRQDNGQDALLHATAANPAVRPKSDHAPTLVLAEWCRHGDTLRRSYLANAMRGRYNEPIRAEDRSARSGDASP